jgi:hypothetical protein
MFSVFFITYNEKGRKKNFFRALFTLSFHFIFSLFRIPPIGICIFSGFFSALYFTYFLPDIVKYFYFHGCVFNLQKIINMVGFICALFLSLFLSISYPNQCSLGLVSKTEKVIRSGLDIGLQRCSVSNKRCWSVSKEKLFFLSIASFKMHFREHKTLYFFISGSVVFFSM